MLMWLVVMLRHCHELLLLRRLQDMRRVGLSDLGEYSCSIANGHGEDRRTVKLNRVGQWMVVLTVVPQKVPSEGS